MHSEESMGGATNLTPYRFGSGFSGRELRSALAELDRRDSSLPADFAESSRFANYYSQAIVARERRGSPQTGGAFERACGLMIRYEFSDPRIVIGHFDPRRPLLGRPVLLEMCALGFHFLGGVRVTAVRNRRVHDHSSFGYRYDTLAGHIECGSESFQVTKYHATGEVWLRIAAAWKPGDFPNWWSRLGFALIGTRYQRAWHRSAYVRVRQLLGSGALPDLPPPGRILHEGRPLTGVPSARFGVREPPSDARSERGSLVR